MIWFSSLMHMQVSNKLTNEGDGKQLHVHLMMGNLAGCFFNFGSADSSFFPLHGRPEA
jgi:hypothetical protein